MGEGNFKIGNQTLFTYKILIEIVDVTLTSIDISFVVVVWLSTVASGGEFTSVPIVARWWMHAYCPCPYVRHVNHFYMKLPVNLLAKYCTSIHAGLNNYTLCTN
jgi:hypothetical protein